MSEKEMFVERLHGQKLQHSDVIFVLQGDGINRAAYAVELLEKKYAPLIAVVGGADDRSYGSFPSSEIRDEMLRLGASKERIYLEETSLHTRAEAERAMQLAKEMRWKSMLILTSPHHQYRTFLTFLKAMRDVEMELRLVNAPAPLSMTEDLPWGRREDLLEREFERIALYQKKGDVSSFSDGATFLGQ